MACCFAVESEAAESIRYLDLFHENICGIACRDMYRDRGTWSVGAIAGGRQRGQRPASAIRPEGERQEMEKQELETSTTTTTRIPSQRYQGDAAPSHTAT